MATGVPTLSRTVDDIFTTTWYEIRPEAIDNILDANVITAALKAKGCFKPQVGGNRITRTLRYGTKTATNVQKGDVLSSGEDDIETMAWWDWAYSTSHVQRSYQDDQQNTGPSKIKSLVAVKLEAARDALSTMFETNLLRAYSTSYASLRAPGDPNGLYDIFSGVDTTQQTSSYTYGNIARDNPWWKEQYETADDPADINLLENMRTTFNKCGDNQDNPDLIITTRAQFEIYESVAVDMSQMVMSGAGNKLFDLGYQTAKFKGADVVWTSNSLFTAGTWMFLTTKFIDFVYDPNSWFDMTEWKYIPLQLERIAHFICAYTLVCSQLRKQALLASYT